MALQYTTISENDLAAGEDLRSSETSLRPGFWEKLLNGDTIERRVTKRVGYQQACGWVPVRVFGASYSTGSPNTLELSLDGSIDITSLRSSPLTLRGRTTGTLGVDTVEHFPGFVNNPRTPFPAGPNTLGIPAASHSLPSSFFWVGTAASNDPVTLDNSIFLPDSVIIDKTLFDVSIDTTAASSFDGLVYYLNTQADAGVVYQGTATVPVGLTTISIPTGTHGLNNFNILAKVWHDRTVPLEKEELLPDAVRIDASSGDVEIDVVNDTGGALDLLIGLVAAPVANKLEDSVARNNPSTLAPTVTTVELPTGTNPFIFLSIYLRDAGSGDLDQVLPMNVSYDSIAQTHSVTFENASDTGKVVEIYWTYGSIISNKLVLESVDARWGAAPYGDTAPQLTLWGLDHCELYPSTALERAGWVSGIDGYRRSAEQRLLCSLGGNLFSSRTFAEFGDDHLLSPFFARLRNRVDAELRLAPLFHDTGEAASRTRGYITATNVGDNLAEVVSVSYDAVTGNSDYVLSLPSKTILASDNVTPVALSAVISTTTDLEDYLTVGSMGWAIHNGTFRITEVEDSFGGDPDVIRIRVDNPGLSNPDCDEVDAGGAAGVFTDQIPLQTDNEFTAGDRILSSSYDETTIIEATTGTIDTLVVSIVTEPVNLAEGLLVTGQRTSKVLPLRDLLTPATVSGLVRGDNLERPETARQFTIKDIVAEADRSFTVVGNGETGTITLTSGDTTALRTGQTVFFIRAGVWSGQHIITDIVSSTVFTVSSTLQDAVGGTLLGQSVVVDEDLLWTDVVANSESYTVPCRWIPAEKPDDSFGLTPTTRPSLWQGDEYDNQNFKRSTMVGGNLYFVDGQNEVMKFDGTNVYRAGLFRWQPGQFVCIDTSSTAKILANSPSITAGAIGPRNTIKTTAGEEVAFRIGDRVRYDDGAAAAIDRTIVDIDTTNSQIVFNLNLDDPSGTPLLDAGTLTKLTEYRYYYRLNAIDANNNIIASAYTGLEDFRVQMGANAAIHHRLVGMPAWDIYDYDRLEVEIYRTTGDGPPVFFRITNLPLLFNEDDGYIDFVDTVTDDELVNFPTDPTALLTDPTGLGPELSIAATWREPLRARFITSAGNRLVLGNITDYPQLDISMYDQLGLLSESDLLGKLWKFRRDSTDVGAVVSDGVTGLIFEWLDDSSKLTIGSTVVGADTLTFDVGGAPPVSAGDWIYSYNSTPLADNNPVGAGWFQVESVGATDIVVSSKVATSVVPTVDSIVYSTTDATHVPVLLGTDGNRETSNGNSGLVRFVSMKRLGEAINASQRQITTEPWLLANYGGEFQSGQLIVRLPRADALIPEVVLDGTVTTEYDIFINGLRRAPGVEATMIERIYPSRTVQSYDNFPEIFENPTAVSASDSLHVRDINSADGQDLTGVINFFGDSVSQDSQRESVVLTFKENSIYAYNVNSGSPAQRLETQGLGCTAPYSVAPSNRGINFANESGIYQITRGMQLKYIGRYEERNWTEVINRNRLDLMQGHHYSIGRKYKLSVPVGTDTANSQVFVYDHTRENLADGHGLGAWTRYDNHPATGWTNLGQDAYFGSTKGRVFSIRRAGDVTDYRDDDQPINWEAIYRELDFGNSGSRKILSSMISHFRNVAPTCCVDLTVNTETYGDGFQETDTFHLTGSTNANTNGLSDQSLQSVTSIKSGLDRRKFLYLQVKYSNSQIDEPVELARIDFRVALGNDKGILQAAGTVTP